MLNAVTTKQFEKDVKLASKRGKELEKLYLIMDLLLEQKPLPTKNRDHHLTGNYAKRKECHIEPDWLLIYLPSKEEILFERTGSHSDLFR